MTSLPGTPGGDAIPTAGSALNPIAVGDIVALGVRVEWPEAVAVIAELCALLRASESTTWVPDPGDVVITTHGTVLVRSGGAGTHEVDDLGRMLHSLLDPASTPMTIRLFLTQSIGFGRYTTVGAYADALSYYERPGRAELIESLYQRCLDTPANALEPRPSARDEDTPVADPPRPRRRHGAVALAVALCCGITAAAVTWTLKVDVPIGAVPALKEVVSAAATAVVERVGWEPRPESAEPIERVDVRPDVRPASRTAGARAASPEAEGRIAAAAAPDAITPPALASESAPPRDPGAAPGAAIEGGLALAPAVLPPALLPDPMVYSHTSEGVEPPVMYFPQLPPVTPAGKDPHGLNTMELLVDESGAVQVAKLTSRPVRLPDMTLLSAAKTWRFHPATKDGRPVKYRLTVSWTVTPP